MIFINSFSRLFDIGRHVLLNISNSCTSYNNVQSWPTILA